MMSNWTITHSVSYTSYFIAGKLLKGGDWNPKHEMEGNLVNQNLIVVAQSLEDGHTGKVPSHHPTNEDRTFNKLV